MRAGRVTLTACFAPFVFLVCCAAQQAPSTFSVGGIVKSSLTHQPVARALVESASDAVLTDSQGRFELHLPEGGADISVRRPGYEGQETGRPPAQLRVNVSANTQPVTIFLTPVASITGHVTLSSGDQAAGIEFILFRKQIEEGHAHWMHAGHTITDSVGTFHFPGLAAPAAYVLCTLGSADRNVSSDPGTPVPGYPGACYPGGAAPSSAIAAPLTLSPGQQAQLEFSFTRQPFYPVSISVAGSSASRPPLMMILDRSGLPANVSNHFNDRSGSWEFILPNGNYYAESPFWGDAPAYGRLDFTVAGAPVSGLTLVPAPVVPIPVEIREEFTANPAPVFGEANDSPRISGPNGDQPPVQISFDPVDRPLDGARGVNIRRNPGSMDTFLMDRLQQGVYLLDVRAFGPQTYAASITSGSTDLLREPLIIGAGSSVQPIQITLRNDTGFLQCTTKAGLASVPDQGAAGASPIPVYAIPTDSGPHRIYSSYVQSISLPMPPLPLPPGKYLVLAFEKEREIDLDDADAMTRLAAQGQTVTIQPNATLDLQVDPIRNRDEETAQ